MLLFLLYTLWRRRQGHTYSEIMHFRRHSGTIIMGKASHERLTALPIYHETRYSVRSSKHGSSASLGKHVRRPSEVPPAVAQRFYAQNPWIHDIRGPNVDPPTPIQAQHPLSQVTTAEVPRPKAPEMVRVYTSHGMREETARQKSEAKPGPSISVRPVSKQTEDNEDVESEDAFKEDPRDRWSWTNSQAPPTPRYASSMHSSPSSLPRFRNVKSWVRQQSLRPTARLDDERGAILLKNKASKPNLAPKPTRKLSKISHDRSSHEPAGDLIIQSNVDLSGPVRPEAARLKNALSFPRIAPI